MLNRRFRITVVIVVLGALLQTSRAWAQVDLRKYGTQNVRAAQMIEQGMKLYDEQQYPQALKLFEGAEKLDPACHFAGYNEALTLGKLGRIDEATAKYKHVIKLGEPHGAQTNISYASVENLALTYAQLGQADEAIYWFGYGLLDDPDNKFGGHWKLYRNLAIALHNSKRYSAAMFAALQGFRTDPQKVEEKMVDEFARNADQLGDPDAAQWIQPWLPDGPPPAPRSEAGDLTAPQLQLSLTDPIVRLLPDPAGEWVIAQVRDAKFYYVLSYHDNQPWAERVELNDQIYSASLAGRDLYLLTKNPSALVKMDVKTSKEVRRWTIPQASWSFAVLPSQRCAYFHTPDKQITELNLETGEMRGTEAVGQYIVAHPTREVFYTYVKDDERGGPRQIIINGRPIIIDRGAPDLNSNQAMLMSYAIARNGKPVLTGLRQRAGWNGQQIVISPDGRWVAVVAGGGWRPTRNDHGAGYGVGVMRAENLESVRGFYATDAYPQACAFNPVTQQVAVMNADKISLYTGGDPKPMNPAAPKGHDYTAAWSGDGRYLWVARKGGGVTFLMQSLSDAEKTIAASWWKDIAPTPDGSRGAVASGPGAPSVAKPTAAEPAEPVDWLKTFTPSQRSTDTVTTLKRALDGGRDSAAAWQTAMGDDDKAKDATQQIAGAIQGVGSAEAGIRIYRFRQLSKTLPDALPVKLHLGKALAETGQYDEARKMLLEVVHGDAGATELSAAALRSLGQIETKQQHTAGAAHCLAAALYVNRSDRQTVNDLLESLNAAKLTALAAAVEEKLGPATPVAAVANGGTTGDAVNIPDTADNLPGLPQAAVSARRLTAAQIYRVVGPSVVMIQRGGSTGSGFCVAQSGLIVTNHHVINDRGGVMVYTYRQTPQGLQRQTPIPANVVYQDRESDVAVLKLTRNVVGLKPLDVVNETPAPGSKVYVIGSPGLGNQVLEQSISDGIVSASRRVLQGNAYIQHTAAVNPGNSGGPMLNEAGQVVGIVTLKADLENVSFAIPAELLHKIFPNR